MKFRKEGSIEVSASPDVVYDYVSDIPRHSEWGLHKLTIRQTGPGRYASNAVLGPMDLQATIRIEAAERPHRFAYVCDDRAAGVYLWYFQISPSGGGSRIRYGLDRLQAPLWVQLVQPWLLWNTGGRQGLEKGLANIKRILEGPATRSATAPNADIG